MTSLDFAKKALQHVWAEFINHFDAAANVDLLFPMELIDFSTMDLVRNAKSKKEANQAFLYHLMNNATVESLWKLCELLRDTARDHHLHDSLAKSLEDELKQFTVPLSSPEAVQKGGRGGDGPSSSQSTTSELSNKVFSDENAASRLGIVAALDLSEGTSQPIVHIDAYLAKDPPHKKVQTAFFRLQSRLANIFNKHCDIADLKLFLRLRQKSDEWPFKELEVEEIDSMKDIRTIFGKICIDWLNTEAFIRLIDVLPDEKSRDDAKRLLEDYHKLLGFFGKCVLLSHIPKDDARLEHLESCMFPKLRVTYDINMEDFDVSKLFKQQNFWSKAFKIPEEAFHYLKAERSSTLVTWALAISIEKAFKLFQRVTHEFWSVKEHLIIKVEIESDGILQLLNHLNGRNLLYHIKKALQGNQDLLACTEHVSRQFLALVDYSHLQRKGTEDKHNTTSASLRSLKAEETKLKQVLQAADKDADRKVAPVKAQLLSKEKDLEKEVATITERDDQMSKRKREIQELKRQAKERDEEKTMMMRRQENLEERNQGLISIRTTQQAEINGLEGRCKDLESQVADWKKKDKDMWEMASDYIDRKIAMMSKIKEYREQKDKLVAKNLRLFEEYKKLKIENARLKLYDPDDEYYDAAPDEDSEKTETKSKRSSWGLPMMPAWFSGSSSKQEHAKPDTGLSSSDRSVSNKSTDSGVMILEADCHTSSYIGMEENTDDMKEDKKAKRDIKSSIGKGKVSNKDWTQAQGKPLLQLPAYPRKLDTFDDHFSADSPSDARWTSINSHSTAATFTDTLCTSPQLPHRGSVVSKPSAPLNVPTPKPSLVLARSNSDRKPRSKSQDTRNTSYGTTKPGA